MSRTLYLYLDACWPQQHLDCPWCLMESGKPPASGLDAPPQWPKADGHVAVLPPEQLVYHQVKLPPGVNWKDAAAVSMALEDLLLDDVSRMVVVPLRQHGDEVVCCTLQRQRLEQLLACMQELGRPLQRVEPLTEKLPAAPGEWRIYQNADGQLWLHDGVTALELDTPEAGELPAALSLRHAQGEPPSRVVLQGVEPALLQSLQGEWNLPVERVAALDWRSTLNNPSPNLLTGDWLPRHKPWKQPAFKKSLVVIAACAAIQLLMTLGSLGHTWWSIRQVQAEQQAVWQEAAGDGAEATGQPVRQLQQQWLAARTRVGESRPDEFIPMLAALSQHLSPGELTSLDFEQGRLIVVWSGSSQDARTLETAMKQRGYTAVTQSVNNGTVTTALAAKEL